MSQLVDEPCQQLSVTLACILDGPTGIAFVRSYEPCRRQGFAADFLDEWDGRLDTTPCRLALVQIYTILQRQNGTIEGRNSQIRKLMKRDMTWAPHFRDVSAHFLLKQQADIEGTPEASPIRSAKTRKKRKHKKHAPGPMQAFMHAYLPYLRSKYTEMPRGALFKEAHKDYKHWLITGECSMPNMQNLCKVVRAAKTSVKSGGVAFGARKRNRAKPESTSSAPTASTTAIVSAAPCSSTAIPAPAWLTGEQALELRAHQEATQKNAQDASDLALLIKSWQADQLSRDTLGSTNIQGLACSPNHGQHLPPMSTDSPIAYIEFSPPSLAMAEQVLSQHRRPNTLIAEVDSAWEKIAQGIRSRDLPKLPKAKAKSVKPCYYAQFCVCNSPEGRLLAHMVACCMKALRDLLRKGTQGRLAYDQGLATMLICPEEASQQQQVRSGSWAHLGYGNLNTSRFTVTPLRLDSTVGDTIFLRPVCPEQKANPLNLWKFFRLCKLTKCSNTRLHVLIAALDTSEEQFHPFQCDLIKALLPNPGITKTFWGLDAPHRIPVGPPGANPFIARPLAGGEEVELLPLEDLSNEECELLTTGTIHRAFRDVERWVQEFELSDSDTECPAPEHGAPPGPGGSAAPPPPAPVAVPARPRNTGPRRPRRPTYIIAGIGKIIYDPDKDSLGMHCNKHGAACKVNRVCHKDPMGYLLAWLLAGQESCITTRKQHFDLRRAIDADYNLRNTARVLYEDDEALTGAFATEHGNGEEPHGIVDSDNEALA